MDTCTLSSKLDGLILDPPANSPPIKDHHKEMPVTTDISIPGRVFCNIPIRIGKSSMPGAGRGTFILKKVKAGDLIYSINQPTIQVVTSDHIEYTCDNCYAIQADDEKEILSNVSRPVEISRCARCKSVAYCSKKCQTEAWKHHHQLECKKLALMREVYDNHLPHPIRILVRLIMFLEKKLLSEEQVLAINSLEGHVDAHINPQQPTLEQSELKKTIFYGAAHIKTVIETEMEVTEIRELFCKVFNNSLALTTLPVRSAEKFTYRIDQPCDTLGACFDPFVALINHNCSANAFWIFEGKQLRIGAARDIDSGEEITISYRPPSSFVERQVHLKKSYHFTCTCETCRAGADRYSEIEFQLTPPMKSLRCQAYDFNGRASFDQYSMETAQAYLRLMVEVGIPEYFAPIPYLHALVVAMCLSAGKLRFETIDTTTLLRSQLKVQYLLAGDSGGSEVIVITLRTTHIMQIILAKNNLVTDVFPEMVEMEELDPAILTATRDVYWYARMQLIHQIQRVLGDDSNIASFEMKRLKDDMEQAGVGVEVTCFNDVIRRAQRILEEFAKKPLNN